MTAISRVALVAKPWRGGLADYVAMALEEKFPGRVQRIHTYPITGHDKREYRSDRRAWRMRLTDTIQSLDADAVLFLNVLPEFSRLARKSEYVVWLTDNPSPVLGALGPFGHVFLSDPGYAESVRRVVGDPRFAGVLPFACDPGFHKTTPRTGKEQGFCFIANRDAKRDRMLSGLFRQGRRVRVYGNYFMRHALFLRYPLWFRPPVDAMRMGSVYARHFASLNIHAEVVLGGTNMRTFECAAYGIPQLVEYRPGIEDLYDPAEEVYMFHDEREALTIMDEMEADPVGACRRAKMAQARTLEEHTYAHRIERMLSVL